MNDVQDYADAVMAAIDEDIAAELIPAGVASFAELHDYVDANGYLDDAGVPWGSEDGGTHDTANAVTDEVSRRLAARAHEGSRPRPIH